jgi:hypothetical protein
MCAQTKSGRRVVAQISMTLDRRVTGPEGPADMEVIARYAVSDAAHARSAELPRSSWLLTDAVTADDGALLLTYDG